MTGIRTEVTEATEVEAAEAEVESENKVEVGSEAGAVTVTVCISGTKLRVELSCGAGLLRPGSQKRGSAEVKVACDTMGVYRKEKWK